MSCDAAGRSMAPAICSCTKVRVSTRLNALRMAICVGGPGSIGAEQSSVIFSPPAGLASEGPASLTSVTVRVEPANGNGVAARIAVASLAQSICVVEGTGAEAPPVGIGGVGLTVTADAESDGLIAALGGTLTTTCIFLPVDDNGTAEDEAEGELVRGAGGDGGGGADAGAGVTIAGNAST